MRDAQGRCIISARSAAEAALVARDVVDRNGRLRLLPAKFWLALDPQLVRSFAVLTARWCIVTEELCAWLADQIAGRTAIEIGAGNGDLGYYLGVPQTDSYAHVHDPQLQLWRHEARLNAPPEDVLELDALEAVRGVEVAIGAWMTERGMPETGRGAFYQGVRETQLVQRCAYIHVGATNVHAQKRILALPHEEHAPAWLVSRTTEPGSDRIWVWSRQPPLSPKMAAQLNDEVDPDLVALLQGCPRPDWVPTSDQLDALGKACGVGRRERLGWRRGRATLDIDALGRQLRAEHARAFGALGEGPALPGPGRLVFRPKRE